MSLWTVISYGPIYVAEDFHKSKHYKLECLCFAICMGWAFVFDVCVGDPDSSKGFKNFYTKERIVSSLYFLPVLSLGLLWLI
jgi:hypothetical protein